MDSDLLLISQFKSVKPANKVPWFSRYVLVTRILWILFPLNPSLICWDLIRSGKHFNSLCLCHKQTWRQPLGSSEAENKQIVSILEQILTMSLCRSQCVFSSVTRAQ